MAIIVGDIVDVSLAGGGLLPKVEVVVVPGNNQVYWEFVYPALPNQPIVVGPSLISIEKRDI